MLGIGSKVLVTEQTGRAADVALCHACVCPCACTLSLLAHALQSPSTAWGALQFRAWDFSRPLLVAPAMNTFMWDSPFTAAHLEALQRLGVKIIPPVQTLRHY